MSERIFDLRSDTVTRPTVAMRAAMMSAAPGADVFGDDPTVLTLQSRIAQLLGKEDALFLPTGTQSNLCGQMAHCQRGDEELVGQMAHTYRWEGAGAVERLRSAGLLCTGQSRLRLVTHLDVGRSDIDAAVRILRDQL